MGERTAGERRGRRRHFALVFAIALGLLVSASAGCGISLTGVGDATSNDAASNAPLRDDDAAADADPVVDASEPDVEAPDAADAAPPPPGVGATTRASVSLTVDQVKRSDGAIGTDGVFDGVFDVAITGPAVAVALLRTTADGTPTGFEQWDTWVGTDAIPGTVRAGYAYGLQTYQLGVFEGGVCVNDASGRVTIPAGSHSLRLFASNVNSFVSGNYFRVLIEDADHTILPGPVVAY